MAHRRSMSDGYTQEDLGVTKAEFNRLLWAIDDGVVPTGVAFSKRNISLFQHGGMRVDELIRNWSVNGYKDPFAYREIVPTQRELEDIIHEAAENTQRFVEYRIEGTTTRKKHKSQSLGVLPPPPKFYRFGFPQRRNSAFAKPRRPLTFRSFLSVGKSVWSMTGAVVAVNVQPVRRGCLTCAARGV